MLILSSLLLIALTCKKDSATNPEDNNNSGISSQKVIGASGGKVEDGYGASITVPAKALSAKTTISVRTVHADSIPPGWQSYLVANMIECLPDGATFQQPVTVTMPVTSGRTYQEGDSANLCLFNTTSGAWEITAVPAVVMADGRHLRAQVTHFSGVGTTEPGSFGGGNKEFDSIDNSIELGTIAEGWAYHIMQSLGPIGVAKKRIRDCCYVLKNVVFHFKFVSPAYSGNYNVVYGDPASCDKTDKLRFDEGTPADGYHMGVDVICCLSVCNPDLNLTADPDLFMVPDHKGKTADLTATVRCGNGPDAAFNGQSVKFELESGPGTVSPSLVKTNAQGVAQSTYTVEKRGIASIRAEVPTCQSAKPVTAAKTVSVKIDSLVPDHIYAKVNIHHGHADMPWTFDDKVEMWLKLEVQGDNAAITGGEGSHNARCVAADSECSIVNLSAPSFTPTGKVTKSGDSLTIEFNPNLAIVNFIYRCDFGGGDGFSRSVPAYSYLVSSVIAMYVKGTIKMEWGSFVQGSGSERFGEDFPLTYEFEIVYGTKDHP